MELAKHVLKDILPIFVEDVFQLLTIALFMEKMENAMSALICTSLRPAIFVNLGKKVASHM